MEIGRARRLIIKWSLVVTGVTFLFLILAPAFGYPLDWDQVPRLFEVILPVFLGYLGSASHFAFRRPPAIPAVQTFREDLGALLVKGPIVVFSVAVVALGIAFGYSNRRTASLGSGMSVDRLAGPLAAILGLLTVRTNVAVSYLFSGSCPKSVITFR